MSTTIHLEWDANDASELVTGYQVWRSVDGGEYFHLTTVSTTHLDIVNPDPAQYSFKIKALNFVGASPLSAAAVGPGLPSAPSTPTLTVIVS